MNGSAMQDECKIISLYICYFFFNFNGSLTRIDIHLIIKKIRKPIIIDKLIEIKHIKTVISII